MWIWERVDCSSCVPWTEEYASSGWSSLYSILYSKLLTLILLPSRDFGVVDEKKETINNELHIVTITKRSSRRSGERSAASASRGKKNNKEHQRRARCSGESPRFFALPRRFHTRGNIASLSPPTPYVREREQREREQF